MGVFRQLWANHHRLIWFFNFLNLLLLRRLVEVHERDKDSITASCAFVRYRRLVDRIETENSFGRQTGFAR